MSSGSDMKTIPLIYCVNLRGYHHDIRQKVMEKLVPFNPYINRHSRDEYPHILRSSWVSVAVPGWGTACKSHVEALAAGSLLFAYNSIKTVKLLPFGELIDGYNFVSFNLDNLEGRLRDILTDRDLTLYIIDRGKTLFNIGYSPQRTGEKILDYFLGRGV